MTSMLNEIDTTQYGVYYSDDEWNSDGKIPGSGIGNGFFCNSLLLFWQRVNYTKTSSQKNKSYYVCKHFSAIKWTVIEPNICPNDIFRLGSSPDIKTKKIFSSMKHELIDISENAFDSWQNSCFVELNHELCCDIGLESDKNCGEFSTFFFLKLFFDVFLQVSNNLDSLLQKFHVFFVFFFSFLFGFWKTRLGLSFIKPLLKCFFELGKLFF